MNYTHGAEIKLSYALLHDMLKLPPDVAIFTIEDSALGEAFLEIALVGYGPCGPFDLPKLVEGHAWPERVLIGTRTETHLEGS